MGFELLLHPLDIPSHREGKTSTHHISYKPCQFLDFLQEHLTDIPQYMLYIFRGIWTRQRSLERRHGWKQVT